MIDTAATRAAAAALATAFDQARVTEEAAGRKIGDLSDQITRLALGQIELATRLAKLEQPAPVPTPVPTPIAALKLGAPFYVRADTAGQAGPWAKLIAKGPGKVGLIVFNPSTGVGATANPDYQRQVAAASAAGIPVIIYVPTGYLDMFGYGNALTVSADGVKRDPKNIKNVLDEVDRAHAFYGFGPVSNGAVGVFLDEMNNKPLVEVINAYAQVRDRIRMLFGPQSLVVQNPGTALPEEMVGLADIFMRFEGTGAKYGAFTPPAWHAKYPGKWWDCAHDVDPAKWSDLLAVAQRNKPSLLWLTDDGPDGNAYNSNPSFLNPLVAALA